MKKLICYFIGHKWGEKQLGWQMNEKFDLERDGLNGFGFQQMTKPWRFRRCQRCSFSVDNTDRHYYKGLLIKLKIL